MLNYLKVCVRRPSINNDLFGHTHIAPAAGSWRDEELFFFDDTDPASTNIAIAKMQSFRGRQPNGTRFQTSVWRSVAAAREIPEVGEPPRALKRVA